jgi:hypothetical protein
MLGWRVIRAGKTEVAMKRIAALTAANRRTAPSLIGRGWASFLERYAAGNDTETRDS